MPKEKSSGYIEVLSVEIVELHFAAHARARARATIRTLRPNGKEVMTVGEKGKMARGKEKEEASAGSWGVDLFYFAS